MTLCIGFNYGWLKTCSLALLMTVCLAGCCHKCHQEFLGTGVLTFSAVSSTGDVIRDYSIMNFTGGSIPRSYKPDESGKAFIPIRASDCCYGYLRFWVSYGEEAEVQKLFGEDEILVELETDRYVDGIVHKAGFSGEYTSDGPQLYESSKHWRARKAHMNQVVRQNDDE